MDDESNGEEGSMHSPEALYRRYRETRSTSAHRLRDNNHMAGNGHQDITQGTGDDPVNLYQRYQRTRKAGSVTTEAMTDLADQAASRRIGTLMNQPMVGESTANIQAIEARQVSVNSTENPINDAGSGVFNQGRWRGVFAVAVIAFGIALIPFIPDRGVMRDPVQATLPSGLSENADLLVSHIELPNRGALGFSATKSRAQVAFHHGVMATDLSLIIESGRLDEGIPLLMEFMGPEPSAASAITDVHQSAEKVFDAINRKADNRVVQSGLDQLLRHLSVSAQQASQLDWYLVGQSVESIKIAAHLASETYSMTPLQAALEQGRKLATPLQVESASNALPKLFGEKLEGANQYIQVQNILKTATEIKSLMY